MDCVSTCEIRSKDVVKGGREVPSEPKSAALPLAPRRCPRHRPYDAVHQQPATLLERPCRRVGLRPENGIGGADGLPTEREQSSLPCCCIGSLEGRGRESKGPPGEWWNVGLRGAETRQGAQLGRFDDQHVDVAVPRDAGKDVW